jgi:hypothetical protein
VQRACDLLSRDAEPLAVCLRRRGGDRCGEPVVEGGNGRFDDLGESQAGFWTMVPMTAARNNASLLAKYR